jgi:uncharacterized circularly permuted ATP-grasp superfamily protein
MAAQNLVPPGRPVCPVMRPHFVARRQFDAMVKAAETLYSAIDRIRTITLQNPALLSRMEMLPAEKMLASVDPGYPYLAVTSMLDTQLHNGSFRFVHVATEGPASAAYSDALSAVFYDCAPVKELRKKYKISQLNSMKRLLHALLAAYKVSGKKKYPRFAIVEFRPPFKNAPSPDNLLMAEFFRRAGYPTEVLTPDQLEYRNGTLCRGDFGIEIVYRRVSAQEFLVRFDLTHPLVRAYRDGAICMVNSFRSEIVQKKAIFSLLTDESITSAFPAAERKAIRDHIPWTRVVAPVKTTLNGGTVDLPDYILNNRERLALRPNDEGAGLHSFRGWETDQAAWERALKTAMRSSYVVQERVDAASILFPVFQFGRLEMKGMHVDVQPQMFLGKVEGCGTIVSEAGSTFSTLSGVAPTFVLEGAA